MIFALCVFCVTITSMPSKFPITDPIGNQFLQAYLPMARRSFNGAIWAGEPSVLYRSEHFILIFRCKRRLWLKQYVQYAKWADSYVVYFIFNKWNSLNIFIWAVWKYCVTWWYMFLYCLVLFLRIQIFRFQNFSCDVLIVFLKSFAECRIPLWTRYWFRQLYPDKDAVDLKHLLTVINITAQKIRFLY